MTAARKSRRARRSAPPLPAPTNNQLFEAMLAFATLKMRYRLEAHPSAPLSMRFIVRVMPEMMVTQDLIEDGSILAGTIHRFPSEDTARRWREHEIIRETIKVAMRTKP